MTTTPTPRSRARAVARSTAGWLRDARPPLLTAAVVIVLVPTVVAGVRVATGDVPHPVRVTAGDGVTHVDPGPVPGPVDLTEVLADSNTACDLVTDDVTYETCVLGDFAYRTDIRLTADDYEVRADGRIVATIPLTPVVAR